MDVGGINLLDWYWDMPPVTRGYLTACTLSTAACALEIITPFHLYYNWHAILHGGQAWRLVTNFLFFGSWGIDFLFHMYFLVNYCRKLEESSFSGRSGDFLACLAFGMTALMCIAPWQNVMFFGSSLSFMMVYLFSRHHPGMQVQLLGILPFTAPYLPWVLLAFSSLLGQSVTQDLLGLAVGHAYFVVEDVYPPLARARGWWLKRIFPNPTNIRAGIQWIIDSLSAIWQWITGPGAGAGDQGVAGAGDRQGVADTAAREAQAPLIIDREGPLRPFPAVQPEGEGLRHRGPAADGGGGVAVAPAEAPAAVAAAAAAGAGEAQGGAAEAGQAEAPAQPHAEAREAAVFQGMLPGEQ